MRPSFITIVIILVTSLVLGACIPQQPIPTSVVNATQTKLAVPTIQPPSSPSPSPTITPDILQGTITIWHSLSDEEIQTIVRIIADFQDLYPDTQFDVLYLPENILLDRYKMAVQEGRGPAILVGPAEWGPELSGGGWVVDLADMVSPELEDRINAAAFKAGTVARNDPQNAVLAGIPFIMDGVVLYRNSSLILFAADSWETLLIESQSITQGEVIGGYLERGFYFSGGHLEGLGGLLINPDDTPAFNSEKGMEWLALLQSFEFAGATDFLTENDLERFMRGQVGYVIGLTTNREQLADAIGSQNLEIDPWPSFGEGYLSGYLFPRLVYLNSRSDEYTQRLAWMFTEFMLAPSSQKYFTEIGRIPAVLDARPDDPLIAQSINAMKGNVASPPPDLVELYRTALDEALLAVFSGGLTPQEALANAETVILEALAGNQPSQLP